MGGIGWVSEDDWMPLPPGASRRRHAQRARERALWDLRGRPLRRVRAEVAYAGSMRRSLAEPVSWWWLGCTMRAAERIAGRPMPLRKRLVPKPRLVPWRLWEQVDWLVWAVRERRKGAR